MYGKPSRRLISRIFEKGSEREPFLRLIIAPKSICSCPGYAGQTNKSRESKTDIHEPVAHADTNRETDTCVLMTEKETVREGCERESSSRVERTHRENDFFFCRQIKSKSYLHFQRCYLTHSLAGDSKPHFN